MSYSLRAISNRLVWAIKCTHCGLEIEWAYSQCPPPGWRTTYEGTMRYDVCNTCAKNGEHMYRDGGDDD